MRQEQRDGDRRVRGARVGSLLPGLLAVVLLGAAGAQPALALVTYSSGTNTINTELNDSVFITGSGTVVNLVTGGSVAGGITCDTGTTLNITGSGRSGGFGIIARADATVNVSGCGLQLNPTDFSNEWHLTGTLQEGTPINIDVAGNNASQYVLHNTTDTVKPVFGATPNLSVGTDAGQCSASVSFSAPATDNCGTPTVVYKVGDETITSPHTFSVGTTTVDCTATDAGGTTATTSFTVTVTDSEKPSLGTATNLNATTDPGQCTASVSFSLPSATDECSTPTVVCKVGDDPITSPHAFPVGTTTVNCTATDAAGNSASTSFTVTVTDTEEPALICPPSKIISADSGACTATATDQPTVTDNCEGVTTSGSRSDEKPLDAPLPVGTTVFTWTATDASGNTAIGTQSVTVKDTTSPTISGLSATPNRLWPPNHRLVEIAVNYTGSDNCTSAMTWTLSVTSSEADSGLGTDDVAGDIQIVDARRVQLRAERYGKQGRVYTLTLTGTDAAGNRSQRTATVTVPH